MAVIRALARAFLAAMLLVMPQAAAPQASPAAPGASRPLPREVSMVAGQTQVFRAEGVKRVAVGQGEVLQAIVIEGDEVLVFAKGAGRSTMHIWRAGDFRDDYDITVETVSARQVQAELQALLQHLPEVRSRVVGGKVVIEGGALSDADRARVSALTQRYPDVVDFTSDVGWEKMIMLDVQVVEIPRSRLLEFGLNWDSGPQGGLHAGVAWDAWGGNAVAQRPGQAPIARHGTNAPLAGIMGMNALWPARLNALAESGEAVVLAQPQLLARSGATAEFLAGGEVPYKHVDQNNRATTQFKPYGVSLHMTPRAERNGIVRAHIAVEASAVDQQLQGENGPALKTRRASTEFNVASGQTLVLAGFLSHDRTDSHTGIPLLRDIPGLGVLFGSRRRTRRDIELAIFVTPTIVDEREPALAERIRRAVALTDASRQGGPVLNVPVVPAAGAADMTADHEGMHSGPGSQWMPSGDGYKP